MGKKIGVIGCSGAGKLRYNSASGIYGRYWSIQPSNGEGFLWAETHGNFGVEIENNVIKIPECYIAAFCSEIIRKAQEIGIEIEIPKFE